MPKKGKKGRNIMSKCKVCGYRLGDGVKKCPMCGAVAGSTVA